MLVTTCDAFCVFFFFQAEDGIRDLIVTGVQTCALPIYKVPRTIFMGSEQGLYRTVDGADHWTRVESPLNGLQIWSILLARKPVANAPGSDVVMMVGTCPSRLFRSEDGGKAWTEPKVQMIQECP